MTLTQGLAQRLTEALQLPPIAVSFADDVPPGIAAYQGLVPAGCRFWQEAATRVFATVTRDHQLCSIGVCTHHLAGSAGYQTDLQDALKVFGDLSYVREADLPFIPVLNRDAKVVVYGPLGTNRLPADVVLLFVKASQTVILSEASQQLENGLPLPWAVPLAPWYPRLSTRDVAH
jgi:uncharacterized protein (DUF169 family)